MTDPLRWQGIARDEHFKALVRKKRRVVWTLLAFSSIYYFLLTMLSTHFSHLFKIQVWGSVNVGILFAFSQFIVSWSIALIYAFYANRVFDVESRKLYKRYVMHS